MINIDKEKALCIHFLEYNAFIVIILEEIESFL
jgi:hypothetical protein